VRLYVLIDGEVQKEEIAKVVREKAGEEATVIVLEEWEMEKGVLW